jgi:hypothetical protein
LNLITVQCNRSGDSDDDEARTGVVIARGQEEAEKLCKALYAKDGFDRFKAHTVVEGTFPGPARVLGYTGQNGAFSWSK